MNPTEKPMKSMMHLCGFCFLTASVFAGTEPDAWLTPSWQIRGRYEHASVDAPGLRSADALTFRERIGLKAEGAFGLSAFVEGEFTQAAIDHFDASAGSATSPDHPDRTAINDPENAELNQLWVQWAGDENEAKAGRQRIILDNGAIIGNSGWRQNEQTYDAVVLQNRSIDDLTLFYSFVNRVNRIFGEQADGIQEHLSGNVHLLNARYEGLPETVITGYVYLMDFGDTGSVYSNDTAGVSGKHTLSPADGWTVILSGEGAWQTDGGNGPIEYDAWYGHAAGSVKHGIHSVTMGYEHLGSGNGTSFRTPLATAHAFNGFADALVPARIAGTPGGLGDLYLGYDVKMPWKLDGQVALHWMGQDDLGFDYGKEVDFVLSRKFDHGLHAILKLAFFESDGPQAGGIANPAPFDTTRCSIELNHAF